MGLFDFIFKKLKEAALLREANKLLLKENEELQEASNKLNQQLFIMQDKINNLKQELDDLKRKIISRPDLDALENKYPAVNNILYERTEQDGTYLIDVRTFVSAYKDFTIPSISGKDDDEKALNGLKWIISNITYLSDKSLFNKNEFWSYPYQTLKHKKGDCEDGAILLYTILRKSGIDYRKIRVSAGDTPYGGHCYLTYYYEAGKRWVSLDWCYFPNTLTIDKRKDYKDEELYQGIWFSFNDVNSFSTGTKSEIDNIKFNGE